ncbi:MAG: hypothetical protein ACOYNS_18655, partial [Bacteroidota bacterium]
IFVFNDSQFSRTGVLKFGVLSSDNQWIAEKDIPVTLEPTSDRVFTETFVLPNALDEWSVTAQLSESNSVVSTSKKVTHAIHPPAVPALKDPIALFDPSQEIESYFAEEGILFNTLKEWDLSRSSTVIVNGNVLGNRMYLQWKDRLTEFVKNGGTLVLNEPEFRVVGSAKYPVIDGVELSITQRADPDKGGYDSYVFAESPSHPIWRNVPKEYLKLFNGAYGGEIVSQYDVELSVPSVRLASCGMDLGVTAASELTVGKGKIILFRLQLRGRLIDSGQPDSLFARRVDPVAQQLLMNLIEYGERSNNSR